MTTSPPGPYNNASTNAEGGIAFALFLVVKRLLSNSSAVATLEEMFTSSTIGSVLVTVSAQKRKAWLRHRACPYQKRRSSRLGTLTIVLESDDRNKSLSHFAHLFPSPSSIFEIESNYYITETPGKCSLSRLLLLNGMRISSQTYSPP